MKLYNLERSGNCYKIRLFLSMLGFDVELIPVDIGAGDTTNERFLAMNPNGLVPVLVDESVTIYDSAAILTYLAKSYADTHWLPSEPQALAQVVRWLAFEQSEGRFGLARARATALGIPVPFAQTASLQQSQEHAQAALQIMETQLSHTQWLAGGEQASIADIACYPYTAMCHEGDLSLNDYPSIERWMRDVKALPGYIPLPV